MTLRPFVLERYFARHEFSARWLLSSSECEPWSMSEILAMADAECRGLWEDLSLRYTESAGHPLLRRAVADMYDAIRPEQTLIAAPEEGIFLSMHAVLRRGDHVVCTAPGYQSLHEVARAIGCEVDEWRPVEGESWRFDVNDLDARLRPDTRLLVVNFPHNPTGALPSDDEFAEVVDRARRRSAYLFSDEMYRGLEHGARVPLPAACDVYDRAISLSGLSKAYGLPGLRVGWLATRDHEMLQRAAELKDYTTICSGAPSEILALIALRSSRTILAAQRARVEANLLSIEEFMADHRDRFSWRRPSAGSVAFPRIHANQGAEAFCEKLVREHGIMLLPSTVFDDRDSHVRFGYGRRGLCEGLERLAEVLAG